MAEWRVYGCGSASSSRYLQSSYEFSDGTTRLHIDFGNGALYRRCCVEGDINRALDGIQHLFVTHGHADHTVDLTRHVVAWKYTPGYSPGKPVHLYATTLAHKEIAAILQASVSGNLYEEVYVPHKIFENDRFRIEDLEVQTFPVDHTQGSCGLRIRTPSGIQVAFTSDTRFSENLEQHLHDLDLLVIECSFHTTRHPMHLNLEEVSQLAGEVKPKAVLLVHLYPEMERLSLPEIRESAAQHYAGELFLAQDGLALRWEDQSQQWQSRRMF